jgi:5-methylcytosine-specific restriction enzyme A
MFSYKHLILIIVVLFIIIVAAKPTYFRTINNLYYTFSKLPRLIYIVIAILSLFGLSQMFDPSSTLRQWMPSNNKKKIKILPIPDEDGKRLVSETVKKQVAARQQWMCGSCHRMLDETYEVDHVIPLYKGGSNDPSNLMALDPICHRKKTNADRLNWVIS